MMLKQLKALGGVLFCAILSSITGSSIGLDPPQAAGSVFIGGSHLDLGFTVDGERKPLWTCPGTGNCCLDNGTPGCAYEACCQYVCDMVDEGCCLYEWDQWCAGYALSWCGPEACSTCPGEGDCCENNGTPGCADEACCNVVCAQDSYCCDTAWDDECAGAADNLCEELCHPPLCPPGAEGDCCAANGTPGCDNEECCNAVCDWDSSCCTDVWDRICAEIAELDYPQECQCGVTDVACCLLDGGCADLPADDCTDQGGIPQAEGSRCLDDGDLNGIDDACESACPPGAEGDCCETNGTPGCADAECCRLVCLADPVCCDEFGTWDMFCRDLALDLCAVCSPPVCPPDADGSCCEANGTPGCTNAACCELVCLDDYNCCDPDVGWDVVCVGVAEDLCAPLCECGSFGDYNGDEVWDLGDFARFQACFTGVADGPVGFECACGDETGDGRIDLTDYLRFHAALTGE